MDDARSSGTDHEHDANEHETHDHEHGSHGHGDDHGHEHEHGSGLIGRIKALYHPHSHDASDSIDSALESSAKGIRTVKISLAGLLITAVLQVVIVWFTGSVGLLADTIHNFSDALTSIPLWIAFVLGRRAATNSYTYGYRRAEDLAGLFIVLMIALSAVLAGWESVKRLANPVDIDHIGWLIGAGIVGFIGNELVAVYRIRVGREISSAALIADGHHARTDGLTSLAVVLGGVGVALGFPLADPIIGLLITVAILYVLKDATVSVFRRLMDGVHPDTVTRVDDVAATVDGVDEVQRVRVRWIGHQLDANLQIAVDPELTVSQGHDIADRVTRRLFESVPQLEDIVVHVDPAGHVHDHDHRLEVHRRATDVAHSAST